MSDAEALDDVNHELFDLLEVGVTDRATRVEHEKHVDAVRLAAALLQLLTQTHELVRVAARSVVLLPEHALTFDVARDVSILRLKPTQGCQLFKASFYNYI